MQLSQEQRDEFLELIREGQNRQQASEAMAEKYDLPITATKMRRLCMTDRVFGRQYEEALVEGRGSLTERLERCAVELALGGNWPALRFLLTTYGEAFAWARSSKVEIGGTVEIQAVAGVLSKYLPPDMFDQLMTVVESRMLEEGTAELPVVDAA